MTSTMRARGVLTCAAGIFILVLAFVGRCCALERREDAGGVAGETGVVGAPPPVPFAQAARAYAGARITYYGDSVGIAAALDHVMARQFTHDTGIEVRVVPRPRDATESYATYQRIFQARSADVDVLLIDVTWPGALAPHLVDLAPVLGEVAANHLDTLIQNDTVDGKLVAMPFFTDFGILYYRTDLLAKYGFGGPPPTWDLLEGMARIIQEGERAGNPAFTGFVWQGKAYEGLTCNALEWFYSQGAGTLVDHGRVTVDNASAVKALKRARGWIGGISPRGVTGYEEEDARNVFQSGDAAFMRNWPYAYALGNDPRSPIHGKFDVAPLPHDPGQTSGGTAGGWQVAVSRYSKNPRAAIELLRYLTSPEAQKYRALVGSFLPTLRSVQNDPDVMARLPFLERVRGVQIVTRPASALGPRYNEGSTVFFQGVSLALVGRAPGPILAYVEERLERAMEAKR